MSAIRCKFFEGDGKTPFRGKTSIVWQDSKGVRYVTKPTSAGEITISIAQFAESARNPFTCRVSSKGFVEVGLQESIYKQFNTGANQVIDRSFILLPRKPVGQFQIAANNKIAGWPVDGDWREFSVKFPLQAACLCNVVEVIDNLEECSFIARTLRKFSLKALVKKEQVKEHQNTLWTGLSQDRVLLDADPSVWLPLLNLAQKDGYGCAPDSDHGKLPPGWERFSIKEKHYETANLQITAAKKADGDRVFLDIDLDYYRDPIAHALMEGFWNKIAGRMTNPYRVFGLRWMASRNGPVKGGAPAAFNPPYSIQENDRDVEVAWG